MAKKTKDAAASAKKEAKAGAPANPAKTKNLIRLLNILALLFAVTAFLLQLFAVRSHHWKWQTTDLHAIMTPTYHYSQPNVHEDSRLDQHYGLYSRDVKVYANNDEQLDLWASTRFPRVDDGEENLHHCLSQTSTLRGAFLTCSNDVVSPELCHCRRYVYWNWVIFFEIVALILLGIVVFVIALSTTQYGSILKLAAAGLALLAIIFLLVGLILILTHLKRETHSFADAYPHIQQRLSGKLGIVRNQYRRAQRNPSFLGRAVRRQTLEHNRVYPLSLGQYSYNDTHFQEYSEQARAWVQKPYTSIFASVPYSPLSQQREGAYVASGKRNTTTTPVYSEYGPLLGYDQVFDNTHAGIGSSTILSIRATILSLFSLLTLLYSWLTGKKLGPNTKTVTTTSVTTEYVTIPQDVHVETQPLTGRPISADYDPQRPIGDAVVTARHVQQGPSDSYIVQSEPVIVRNVIIRDEQPAIQTNLARSYAVYVESSPTTYHS